MASSSASSTRAGFGAGLLAAGIKNQRIVSVDADLQSSVQTAGFAAKFPKRAFQVGIAEANMIGVAAGLASGGHIPFAATFAVFATGLTYNQIRQSVCYSGLAVKIVGSHAGVLTGEDGATHQALEDISLMRGLPGMRVYSPADYYQAKAMTMLIAKEKGPCYLRLGRADVPAVYDEKKTHTLRGLDVLHSPRGANALCLVTGAPTYYALTAAKELVKNSKLKVAVANCPVIKPFPEKEVISLVKKYKKIITVEDHQITGGLGSCVAETLAGLPHHPPLIRHGIYDSFGESGTWQACYKKYKLDAKGITDVFLKHV